MVGTYTPDTSEPWSGAAPGKDERSNFQRATRKFKEEPLVPIGIAATVVALVAASSALQKGNRTQFNKYLRLRVAAQGLTVVAALGGSVYYGTERKNARALDREQKGLPPK